MSFCALSFPAMVYLSQLDWIWAALGTILLLLILSGGSVDLTGLKKGKKLLLTGLLLWNSLMLGKFALDVGTLYESRNILPALLLVLLASYAASKKTVPRVAAVLLFFLAGIYTILFAFALPDLRTEKLMEIEPPDLSILPYALSSGMIVFLYRGKESKPGALWMLGAAGLTIGASVITKGMLAEDFYGAAKSVNILGAMERLEPLVAAALTAACFCLLGLLCNVNRKLFCSAWGEEKTLPGFMQFCMGAVGCYLIPLIPERTIAIGATIFWALVPIALQHIVHQKKFEKNQKNA